VSEDQCLVHVIEYIFNSDDLQALASAFILDDVRIEAHMRMKALIHEEENQEDDWKQDVIVDKLNHEQSLKSVILHVWTEETKISFNVLIDSFALIVDLKMIDDEQSKRNAQSFAKRLSENEDELRISIEHNEVW
jgi:hypothetical protein